ncbi:MAG: hypothetical protein ACOVQM_21030 [Pirellula sp.]
MTPIPLGLNMRSTGWGLDMRDIVRGIWPSMLSDPVGVPYTFLALDPGCAALAAPLGFVV